MDNKEESTQLIQTFFIPWILPGANEIIKSARRTYKPNIRSGSQYSTIKKQQTKEIAKIILATRIKKIDKVFLNIIWIEQNRKRDPDNIAAGIKFILDALQLANVIENDGWNNILGWTNEFKTASPIGVHITLLSPGWRNWYTQGT